MSSASNLLAGLPNDLPDELFQTAKNAGIFGGNVTYRLTGRFLQKYLQVRLQVRHKCAALGAGHGHA
jgi:hypothetical protein